MFYAETAVWIMYGAMFILTSPSYRRVRRNHNHNHTK